MSSFIVILLLMYAFYLSVKIVLKKKDGKCGSCHIEHSCTKQSCSIDWDQTLSEALKHNK